MLTFALAMLMTQQPKFQVKPGFVIENNQKVVVAPKLPRLIKVKRRERMAGKSVLADIVNACDGINQGRKSGYKTSRLRQRGCSGQKHRK